MFIALFYHSNDFGSLLHIMLTKSCGTCNPTHLNDTKQLVLV